MQAGPGAERDTAGDLAAAAAWLDRHGMPEATRTPVLAARLAARQRVRAGQSLILALLIIAAALAKAYDLISSESDPAGSGRWLPLLVLTGCVTVLLLARWLLNGWLRRADRRIAGSLPRRVSHSVRLGWRVVLGWPYAAFTVATYAVAAALALGALAVDDAHLRFGATIVLISLVGVAVADAAGLRYVLARPVVAGDESSLTADAVMRIEDARELTVPSMPWALPAVLLSTTSIGWWTAAPIVAVVLGAVAYSLLRARTPASVSVARRAIGA